MANRVKGFWAIGAGIVMIAFGSAGLNSAHAGELSELSPDELRQVDGGVSPLQALSSVVGPLARAGGTVAGKAVSVAGPLAKAGGIAAGKTAAKAAKTGGVAAVGGGISLAQYLAANQASPVARDAALAFGTGALTATFPKSAGFFGLN